MCNLCKGQQNRQKKKKKEKKRKKISTVTLTEVSLKEWHLMKKITGHVTKTEGVADWLICTVHRVTPNCA